MSVYRKEERYIWYNIWVADKNPYDRQALIDVMTFYCALFYKLAAINKFDREDFQKLISETCDYLPVRGGGLGKGGFWDNICAMYNIQIRDIDNDLDERAIKSLSDAIWLPYDQDLQKDDL